MVANRVKSQTTDLHTYRWPDHTELPDEDGSFVKNFQEHPQSILLSDALLPILKQRHPDGQYCIGQDSGIYWNIEEVQKDQPVRGAEAPDWFYVPDVPPLLDGKARRSYVLWYERTPPLIAVEFVSGDGKEERDTTPFTGKFWIYERFIQPTFYAIYEGELGKVEVYYLDNGKYRPVAKNAHGHFPIAPLGVTLGIWHGRYLDMELPWLRWHNELGLVLPTSEERAEQAEKRAERLAAKLRALGLDPDA